MPVTPEDLDEMERLERRAAAGPWEFEARTPAGYAIATEREPVVDFAYDYDDAVFICAARAFVPKAIAEIRRLQTCALTRGAHD